jgi:succinate dehydrogenase/fumarate reductase flavoprotein subunit
MNSNTHSPAPLTCDVLVIGSGAGGLSTAITARKHGLDVVVIEKEACFGGTTAFSGGVLWIPGNRHARANGANDTHEAAKSYMRNETGVFYDEAAPTITRMCKAASISAARWSRHRMTREGLATTLRVCVRR